MLKNKFTLIILILTLPQFAYANYEGNVFSINSHKIIKTKISSNSHTRITIKGDLIKEIIGDDNHLKIINTSSRNHLFIIPKIKDIKVINISLITDKNKAIDLKLELDDNANEVIIIEAEK